MLRTAILSFHLIIIFQFLASCSVSQTIEETATPTPNPGTTPTLVTHTPSINAPEFEETATTGPQSPVTTSIPSTKEPTATPPTQPEDTSPRNSTYALSAVLDYAEHRLEIEEIIDYTNTSGISLKTIPLVVEPRRYPNAFILKNLNITQGTEIADKQWRETQLLLILNPPLEHGEDLRIELSYELHLPQTSLYTNIRPRPFGYTDKQANLGDWYPFIPPYDEVNGWLIHDPALYGEHLVYESADFFVKIQFTGIIQDLVIAASSPVEKAPIQFSDQNLQYQHLSARNFGFSASPYYEIATESVSLTGGENVEVMSYYLPLYEIPGKSVLNTTARALELYSELFGFYPRSAMTVVQADFLDGMEYDGLFFLSKDYYNWHNGTEMDLLAAIAAHETAHQWWYGLVGNDQAMHPWLDEALSTYCERLYYERYDDGALDWWWTYRVNYFEPRGWIDINIYDMDRQFPSYRNYRDVVYLNGAKFLEDLRQLVGEQVFFAFLSTYRERYTNKIAGTKDFFTVLMEFTEIDFYPLVEQYFSNFPVEEGSQ